MADMGPAQMMMLVGGMLVMGLFLTLVAVLLAALVYRHRQRRQSVADRHDR